MVKIVDSLGFTHAEADNLEEANMIQAMLAKYGINVQVVEEK